MEGAERRGAPPQSQIANHHQTEETNSIFLNQLIFNWFVVVVVVPVKRPFEQKLASHRGQIPGLIRFPKV
jgi:hypothetical protein